MTSLMESSLDVLKSSMGLPLFLLDIMLDFKALINFYNEGSYVSLGVLLLVLFSSSVLAQIYRWLWYKYVDFEMHIASRKGHNTGVHRRHPPMR